VTETTARTLAVGGERQVPVPDRSPATTCCSASASTSTSPGSSTRTSAGRPEGARRHRTAAIAAASADDADSLRAASPATSPSRIAAAGSTPSSSPSRRTPGRSRAQEAQYEDQLERYFAWRPVRRDDATFDEAAATLDTLLPGPEPLADRLAAWDEKFVIQPDRLPAVVDWLIARFRERVTSLFEVPRGEELRVSYVRGQPWTAYNWYDGGLRSRVDVNLDLPMHAATLVHSIAHETFPGHHVEHASKEANLVERQGRLEASIQMINAPECLISEGLADIGRSFVAPLDETPDLLVELYARAGMPIAADPAGARDAAERSAAMTAPRRRLQESRVNAALMRHADGASHDEVLAYLRDVGRFAPDVAAKRLEFIEHPLWRTYVFVYHEGEQLMERWLDLDGDGVDTRAARFGRLLREQLTPGAIAADVEASTAAAATGPTARRP
jgi:hypothetical protein